METEERVNASPRFFMRASEPRSVCVVGLGYIGLPTAALLASRKWRVTGVDANPIVVQTVAAAHVHFAEPDLGGLVQKVVSDGTLSVCSEPVAADVYVITVPTPLTSSETADLTYVYSAARSIAPYLAKGNLVILESTSPVGTTGNISELLGDLRTDLSFPTRRGSEADINIAYCPERVLPGRILTELLRNERSIGGISSTCTERAIKFYQTFVHAECVGTTARTAELVKLTENAFRDTNIAFANELSIVCERLGIDVWQVIALANRHPRVSILQPGPGVGGHCIAVDPWFIVQGAPDITPLIRAARCVNDGKADYTFERARGLLNSHPGAKLACLGLSFKANVDDLRESPALQIAERLAGEFGSRILVVEPNIDTLPASLGEFGIELVGLDEALRHCDILLLLVDHEEFRRVPRESLDGKIIRDTRGIWQ